MRLMSYLKEKSCLCPVNKSCIHTHMISVEWSEMVIKSKHTQSKDACMGVSLFFFFEIVKNSHVKMTPLICYDYLTEQVKLQQKCIKNITCKKSLIKQNIINIRPLKYKRETGPRLLSQRHLGMLSQKSLRKF